MRTADIQMSELVRLGRRDAELRRRGICSHGWTQGTPGKPDGATRCLHCGKSFATFAELCAERREILS